MAFPVLLERPNPGTDFCSPTVADSTPVMSQSPTRDNGLSACLSQLMEAEALLLGVRQSLTTVMNADGIPVPTGILESGRMKLRPTPLVAGTLDEGIQRQWSALQSPVPSIKDLDQTPPEPPPEAEVPNSAKSINGIAQGVEFTSEDMLTGVAFGSQQETMAALTLAKKLDLSEDELLKCRSVFVNGDTDNSGRINTSELTSMLQQLTGAILSENEYTGIVRKFDTDQDGELNFTEFAHAFCSTPGKESQSLKAQIDHIHNDHANMVAEKNMTVEERVNKYGVRQAIVVWYLRQELAEKTACFQIPLMFSLLLIWFLAVMFHLRWEELQSTSDAVEFDIRENANFAFSGIAPFENGRIGHKGIEDVNSFADFWSWFSLGIVPLFWPEGWDVSEMRTNLAAHCTSPLAALIGAGWPNSSASGLHQHPLVPHACPNISDTPPARMVPEHPMYLAFHSIIGGVRLSQEHVPSLTCDPDRPTKHVSECYEMGDNFQQPSLHNFFATNYDFVNSANGETHYLQSNTPRKDILSSLRRLEDQGWMNTRTSMAEILFTTYNPHLDIFVGTFIRVYVNRAGHMFKNIEPVCHWIYPYHGWWCYVADFMWLILVLKLLLEDLSLLSKHWRELGVLRGTLIYISAFGNMLCWLSVILSGILIYEWIAYLLQTHELRDYIQRANPAIPGSFGSKEELAAYYELVYDMSTRALTMRTFLAGYPFVIGVRLFRSFDAQPRLALVTKTLQTASTEIVHFGVVFFSAFLIYAAAAMVLFGPEIEDFSTISRAATSVFLVLIGGFDWEVMEGVGLPQAMLWFWTFVILVNLIMLNMLLAIVMDVYTDVKSDLPASAPTMWSQVAIIHRRWRELRRGERMSLRVILKALDPQELDTKKYKKEENPVYLSIDALLKAVPGLTEKQATRTLENAMYEHLDTFKEPSAITDTNNKILELDKKIVHVGDFLQSHTNLHRASACLTASTHRDILESLHRVHDTLQISDSKSGLWDSRVLAANRR